MNEGPMPSESGLDLSKALQKLSANPEMLSGIFSMLGAGMPKNTESEPPSDEDALPAVLPMPSPSAPRKSNRRELLCALKPFLSAHRCENIDRILHMYDLLDLMKHYR